MTITTPSNPFYDVAVPPAAVTISDWVDVDHPEDTYRSFSGQRRGFEHDECASRGQYIEAFGLQNPDGTLEELAVRAELDVWDVGGYHHIWDDALTPAEARKWAQRLVSDAHKILILADAFTQAADEVEGWAAR
jgi:hypothetical protein